MLTHITSFNTHLTHRFVSSFGAAKQIFSLWTKEILLVILFCSRSLVHTQLCQCSVVALGSLGEQG